MRGAIALIVLLALLGPALARPAVAAPGSAFARKWVHDDSALANGEEQHTWTWGPVVLRAGVEPYHEAPDGRREVWYFDKGRMEVTQPAADPDADWYVSSGLLVRELISGEMQIGDGNYETWQPAPVPVAGDLEATPAETISYADLRPVASIHGEARAEPRPAGAAPLTATISPGGVVGIGSTFAEYAVSVGGYDEVTGHNIAAVFLDALPASSLLYTAGRPLTEPYWARVPVGGKPQDILLQAFERRVLTFTPANTPPWQVEWGNVGRQYAQWRYGQAVDGAAFTPNTVVAATSTIRNLRELAPVAANIARDRRGLVGVAVYQLDTGAFHSFEGTRRFPMYSVAKVPIMLTVLDRAVREGRRVTPWEISLITAMIQVSDNDAATTLLIDVGGARAVQGYLERIGITNTTINGAAWGASTTTAQDMARMMAKLGNCTILVQRLCDYGLGVMRGVVRNQRWGVSAGVPSGAAVALKNGWFPQRSGWGVNSVGLVTSAGQRYAIAVLTNPDPSMAYGIETIEGISTAVSDVYFR